MIRPDRNMRGVSRLLGSYVSWRAGGYINLDTGFIVDPRDVRNFGRAWMPHLQVVVQSETGRF